MLDFDPTLTEEAIKSIVDAVDSNKDGVINYTDLKRVRLNRKLVERECRIRKLFDEMDTDLDDMIGVTDLWGALGNIKNRTFSRSDIQEMIREVDLDDDEKLNYEEFLTMWTMTTKIYVRRRDTLLPSKGTGVVKRALPSLKEVPSRPGAGSV